MSRSNPPRSRIAARVRESSDPAARAPARRPFRRRLGIRFAALMRWLHIYLSLFGLAAVLFFSLTGLTLNHPDWFFAGAERRVTAVGRVDQKWLRGAAPEADPDPSRTVAKLEIVEHLRDAHAIGGALAEFRIEEQECLVTFKGPGYAADAVIDRASGRYDVTQTYHGLVAVVNDLHKGRDTGPVWSVLIDIAAVLMTVIALTGLILLFYLKLRRVPGVVVTLIGLAVVVAVFLLGVP